MSRYTIPGSDPTHVLTVGWDPPLQTFFAQIHDTTLPDEDPRDDCLLWVGTGEAELQTIEALATALGGDHHLPAEVCAQLCADQQAPYQRTPLQEQLLAMVRRVQRKP